MASSLIYDSFLNDIATGAINLSTDTFYVMLVNGYTPTKGTDAKRSNVTNEASGTGYTAGGVATTATLAENTTSNQETVTFGNVSFANATITATGAVIYKSRGGAASADNLVCYVDFGQAVSSTAAAFAVTFSSPLTLQN